MSDIVIKGMELPKGNDYHLLIIQNGKVHKAISCGYISTDELNVADAVELPPHGELVDRNFIITNGLSLRDAPTVLEASYRQIKQE